jgi:hypothetical protein
MNKTIIFIDFDDTLFPTDWVLASNINVDNPNDVMIEMFNDLDMLISDVVLKMKILGNVLIVSNGSNSWIHSCLNVLPNFKQIIDLNVVSVTSARDLFGNEHDKQQWKRLTFKILFDQHMGNIEGRHHILSFGDSEDEHDAVVELRGYNVMQHQQHQHQQHRIIKSIKFIKNPTLNQLVQQLDSIKMWYQDIIHKDEDYVFNMAEFIL